MLWNLANDDCRNTLRAMPDDYVDACVTDPPYALNFMGKKWDSADVAFQPEVWQEVLRVLKPGAHLLAFGGTRTFHRLVCAIEDAGFEIRDSIAWLYGSGFPKSLDVSKAIDAAAGTERPVIGTTARHVAVNGPRKTEGMHGTSTFAENINQPGNLLTAPATAAAAAAWSGWGTALKPAMELICVARKPLIGTVAANVLLHGTGGINVEACRIGTPSARPLRINVRNTQSDADCVVYRKGLAGSRAAGEFDLGRWPANVIHDGSDEVLALFPESKGQQGAVTGDEPSAKTNAVYGAFNERPATEPRGDTGSAARFFYCSKASSADRAGSKHPTVKPLKLMRYLCRLVTPPGGLILDPFAGSGTALQAAIEEGFSVFGIEQDASPTARTYTPA